MKRDTRPNALGFDSWAYIDLPMNLSTQCENCQETPKSLFFRHYREKHGTILKTYVICENCAKNREMEVKLKTQGVNFV